MAGEARSVVVRLTAENAQFIAQMKAAGTAVDATATQMEAAAHRQSRALDDIGSKAGKVGLAAGLGLAAMGKAAVDWESQWAGVEKTVDGTTGQMAELEAELRGLAKTMPATHEEIAGVGEAAGQLGVAREDISAFTETMVQLGETTNLTAQDAATSIAQMTNVMGTAPGEIDNLGAALVAVGNAGASTEAQIIQMAQGISGAAAVVGLAEADVLGIANAVASIGIEVEAGGTAVSRVLTDMAKATAQGGEELELFAEVAGVSADDFARSFEERPAEALTTFIEGLGRVNAAGGDVFTVLDQLGLSDVRVSRALLGMAADSEKFAGSLDLANSAWSENTALTDEYGKRLDTTAAQVQIAWNQIKDAGIEAGAVLLPAIANAAGAVGDLAGAFQALPGPVKSSLTGLLGITAVLGGSVWAGSKIIGGITGTRQALADLAATSPRAARGLSLVAKAGGALVALEIGSSIIDSLRESAKGAAPDVAELTAALSEMDASALQEELGGSLSELLDAADTGALEDLSIGVGSYVDKMGLAGDAIDVFVPGLHSVQDQADKAAAAAGSLDEAIAGLAATGGPERAAAAFRQLAEAEGLSASEQERIIDQLPALKAAIGDAAGGTEELAASGQFLQEFFQTGASGAGEMSGAMDDAADSVDGLVSAMNGLTGFLDRAEAMRNYAESVRDVGKALKDGFQVKDVETIHQMGREIVSVAETLANRPTQQRGFLEEARQTLLNIAGDSPKARAAIDDLLKYVNRGLDALDDTTVEPEIGANDDEFRNKVGANERRLRALAALEAHPHLSLDDKKFQQQFGLTKADLSFLNAYLASPTARLDGNALSQIAAVQRAMNAINGQRSTVYINTVRTVQDVGPGRPQIGGLTPADGTTVPGPRFPYRDSVPAFLAPTEEVISNRVGQADAFRPELKDINAGLTRQQVFNRMLLRGLARGGTAGFATHADGDSVISGPDVLNSVFQTWEQVMLEEARLRKREIDQRLREAQKRTEALEKELDTAEQVRDGWRDAIESLSETVVGKLTSDVFGEDADFASIIAGLEGDKALAQEFARATNRLAALGLEEDALQALIDQTASPEQLIDFANIWTQEQVDQFEQLFNSTQATREQAGQLTGERVFGEREDAATAVVRGLREDLKKAQTREKRLEERSERMEKIAERMEELAKKNPRETGEHTANALDKAASQI